MGLGRGTGDGRGPKRPALPGGPRRVGDGAFGHPDAPRPRAAIVAITSRACVRILDEVSSTGRPPGDCTRGRSPIDRPSGEAEAATRVGAGLRPTGRHGLKDEDEGDRGTPERDTRGGHGSGPSDIHERRRRPRPAPGWGTAPRPRCPARHHSRRPSPPGRRPGLGPSVERSPTKEDRRVRRFFVAHPGVSASIGAAGRKGGAGTPRSPRARGHGSRRGQLGDPGRRPYWRPRRVENAPATTSPGP